MVCNHNVPPGNWSPKGQRCSGVSRCKYRPEAQASELDACFGIRSLERPLCIRRPSRLTKFVTVLPKGAIAAGLALVTLLCSSAAYGQSEDVLAGPSEESPAPASDVAAPASEVEASSVEDNIVYVPIQSEYRPYEPGRGFVQRVARFFGLEWRERLFSPPLGSSLREHVIRHRVGGRAARAVLYNYDFQPNSSELNQRGREHVRKLAVWVRESGVRVVVEHTPNSPELAVARQQVVIGQLQNLGISDASDVVMIGRPLVRGLRASEVRKQAESQKKNSSSGTVGYFFGGGGGSGGAGAAGSGGASGGSQ